MYGISDMVGTYEERKVQLDEFDWGMVSTARVTDGTLPYETAVEHRDYADKDGQYRHMVIVENYATKEEALIGHSKWVALMTSDPLPEKLADCNNSGLVPSGIADETYTPE